MTKVRIHACVLFSSFLINDLFLLCIKELDSVDYLDEVEKQIDHLEKLVPDWFYKKLVSSGDILYK